MRNYDLETPFYTSHAHKIILKGDLHQVITSNNINNPLHKNDYKYIKGSILSENHIKWQSKY